MLASHTVATARLLAGSVAVLLAVTGASWLAPGDALLLAAGPEPHVQRTLNINLASSQDLSATSTGALVAEVNAIWWDSNLSLVWRTADVSDPLPAMPESEDWLRVLVLARQTPGPADMSTFAVGELLRSDGARPLAIASIIAARRVVDDSIRAKPLDGPRDYDRRLGVVLGRAVAHEIGHYLLGTSTHAPAGLMRANIGAQEFADVRSRSFRLDEVAQAHLARLAVARPESAQPSGAPPNQLPLFSYASRGGRAGYAAAGGPNHVVSASASPD
jgi:hypothetical protein